METELGSEVTAAILEEELANMPMTGLLVKDRCMGVEESVVLLWG